ncbi:PepSY domain-containing protein [Paucibacter sp. APW11]|uniref:PepSY domain-containing protein n=1 Tax=Roseateles aquae TaxID=3077235 RepID=A0ABU3P6U5_9BURK|nr:PepSY domain-containing protein [Paucibacter sp. APW11]MDT8998284.1 PepSY domain-containing protein [Paucibacter sp. APW11]
MKTKQMLLKSLCALSLAGWAVAALAHGNVSCPVVPKEEKKPQMELQRKLEAEGWKVRQVKNYKNCYEVYGLDAQGKKVEAFFHPGSFERVQPEGEAAKP